MKDTVWSFYDFTVLVLFAEPKSRSFIFAPIWSVFRCSLGLKFFHRLTWWEKTHRVTMWRKIGVGGRWERNRKLFFLKKKENWFYGIKREQKITSTFTLFTATKKSNFIKVEILKREQNLPDSFLKTRAVTGRAWGTGARKINWKKFVIYQVFDFQSAHERLYITPKLRHKCIFISRHCFFP